jgi:hypothetical protein
MGKSVIFEIFGELRDARLVQSEQEFCRNWLGRSECYMRTIRFKRTQPSLGTLAICADRLRQGSETMRNNGDLDSAILLSALSTKCQKPLTICAT